MHRLPDGAGLDAGGVEDADEIVARAAEPLFFDEEATQPVCVEAVGGLGHERDAGDAGKGIAIAEGDSPALADTQIEDFELAAPDAGEDVAHTVVVPEFGVFVGEAGVAGLLRPEARLVHPGLVSGDEHSAACGGDDLVSVEGVDADVAERSGRLTLVERAYRFGGIFDHGDSVLGAGVEDWIHIGALAIEVDHHQRLGEAIHRRPLPQGARQDIGIQVPGGPAAIHKDRHAALVDDGVGCGSEGERRTEHFIASAEVTRPLRPTEPSSVAKHVARPIPRISPSRTKSREVRPP